MFLCSSKLIKRLISTFILSANKTYNALKIAASLQKRNDQFINNELSLFIDSVLNRTKRAIVLDRVLLPALKQSPAQLLTTPDTILSAVVNHF